MTSAEQIAGISCSYVIHQILLQVRTRHYVHVEHDLYLTCEMHALLVCRHSQHKMMTNRPSLHDRMPAEKNILGLL